MTSDFSDSLFDEAAEPWWSGGLAEDLDVMPSSWSELGLWWLRGRWTWFSCVNTSTTLYTSASTNHQPTTTFTYLHSNSSFCWNPFGFVFLVLCFFSTVLNIVTACELQARLNGYLLTYLHIFSITIQPSRSTRSSSLVTLLHPQAQSSLKITNRSFQYAAPHLWNKLPPSLRVPCQSATSECSPPLPGSDSAPKSVVELYLNNCFFSVI